MDFDGFFDAVELDGIELSFTGVEPPPPIRLSNEAMFHLPLIAITVLMLSKGRSKPKVDSIGQVVGECFEGTFAGFHGSAQHLGWSAALRLRTVQALTFLEAAGLVEVKPGDRTIAATNEGQRVVASALRRNGDLAYNLLAIDRNFRNIRNEHQLRINFV